MRSSSTETDPDAAAGTNRPLRFLHVSPSMGPGGREMRAAEIMGMLPQRVEHCVIALDGDLRALERVPPQVSVRVIDPPPAAGPLGRLRGMRALLKDVGADLLLTYNWGSIEWLAAGTWGDLCPVVHHEDGFGPEEVPNQLGRRRVARRVLMRRARAVIAPSLTLFEMARSTWKLSEPRLQYLPNGVDLARFVPAAQPRGDGDLVFVCVGGVRTEKNQALAVEAFARAACRSRARLRIVGDGPERAAVEALAEARGVADRVDMIGSVRDTAPEYQRSDVFLIPSRTEQMPLSLLEAMATALPTVGTDVGDVRVMVDEENRDWIVPPNDADTLARVMDEAAADAARRARIGARNRVKVAREYDRELCYGRYCELYLRFARA